MKGNLIKSRIIESGNTIKEVADMLNINYQVLSNWINGRNTKQIYKFILLLAFLHITVEEIKEDLK